LNKTRQKHLADSSSSLHTKAVGAPISQSLAKLYRRAEELGWRCLSELWTGYGTRYQFECANGHRFERHARVVFYTATRCSECEADEIRTRWTATLTQRGGTADSPFTGLLDRYRLRCANGHEWAAQGRKILEGSWCPRCAHEETARRLLRDDGLSRLQALAAAKDGRCLATAYTGTRAYYPFECAKGHRWEAQGAEIVRGQWCRLCANVAFGERKAREQFYEDGLQRLQDAARRHNGECLATQYTGSHEYYRFRCAAGHEWKQTASQIWFGHWCARCVKIAQRTPMDVLQAIAAERGGRCLSPQAEGNRVKLTWECHLGHVWQSTPASIKSGSWCPNCANLERSRKWASRLRHDFEG
jgi:hypothetical protein